MTTCAVSEAADETGAAGAAACWKASSAKSTCIGALKIAEGERVALPCTTSMTESESHRILVVDDEPGTPPLVASHLARAGSRGITAPNGSDALRTAGQARPARAL